MESIQADRSWYVSTRCLRPLRELSNSVPMFRLWSTSAWYLWIVIMVLSKEFGTDSIKPKPTHVEKLINDIYFLKKGSNSE
jgi:hypothetical protein